MSFLLLSLSPSPGLSPSRSHSSSSHLQQGALPTSTSTATSWYSGCRVTTPNTPCRGCQVKRLSPATLSRCAVSPLWAGPSLCHSAWLYKANSPDCLPLLRLARFSFSWVVVLFYGAFPIGGGFSVSLSLCLSLYLSLLCGALCCERWPVRNCWQNKTCKKFGGCLIKEGLCGWTGSLRS